MAYRVFLQRDHHAPFIDTGVVETNPDQRANWEDICTHCGYVAFRFLLIEEGYHLFVPKRGYRNRTKKAA